MPERVSWHPGVKGPGVVAGPAPHHTPPELLLPVDSLREPQAACDSGRRILTCLAHEHHRRTPHTGRGATDPATQEQLKHALQAEKTSPESQKTISGSVSEKPDSRHLSCRAFRSMLPALARGVYAEPKPQVTHGEKMNWKKQAKSPCLQVTDILSNTMEARVNAFPLRSLAEGKCWVVVLTESPAGPFHSLPADMCHYVSGVSTVVQCSRPRVKLGVPARSPCCQEYDSQPPGICSCAVTPASSKC
ncbi:uncharacterized protein LOC132655349 [Meriones unguiculatus]|uniref:uncharacterized protein LOC132655349 n=1 Tax=Meriones unguiculatus TaxID=10047 RepID=UPI00293E7E50|nr:uncharacterized protein LOC132655349 [Meriones unguiculatus]